MCLILHFYCTPIMILINAIKKEIKWGEATYRLEKGKIIKVTRNGKSIERIESLRKYMLTGTGCINADVKQL